MSIERRLLHKALADHAVFVAVLRHGAIGVPRDALPDQLQLLRVRAFRSRKCCATYRSWIRFDRKDRQHCITDEL
jgi:hypothetical protein